MATATTFSKPDDPLLEGLLMGRKWANPVTFGFPIDKAEYSYTGVVDGFAPLLGAADQPNTQIGAVVKALEEVAALTLLDISPAPAGTVADLRAARTSTEGTTPFNNGLGFYPSNNTNGSGGDTWYKIGRNESPHLGSFAWRIFFHETGHALGLKHGHEAGFGFAALPTEWDSSEFSVMTYSGHSGSPGITGNASGNFPQSYMLLDIKALQFLYGADFTFRANDTLYAFRPDSGEVLVDGVSLGVPKANNGTPVNVIFRTIWDGGGKDTYDFSAYGADRQLAIDLRPGEWTDVDTASTWQAALLSGPNKVAVYARGQVANAFLYQDDPRSLIENALGGSGNDIIIGNQADNHLAGGAGNDSLSGRQGNDHLDGGDGIDTADYTGATGGLRVLLSLAGPQKTLAAGVDRLSSIENIIGGAGGDLLWGDANANRIEGRAGNDFIVGDAGDDQLLGDDGNDVLTGGLGADTLDFGAGRDVARFLSAADSRAFAMDRIIGFGSTGQESDRLGFENNANALFAGVAPTAIALAAPLALATAASIADLVAQLGMLAASTATSLALTRIDVAAGAAAGSYLAVNDTQAAFDAAADMLIGIQFASGASLGAANVLLF